MLAFSEIIDFLLTLMRDETARAEFEQDPQGTLARAGLEGVTGQDISDARLQLADSGAVRSTDDGAGNAGSTSYGHDSDPVQQINYITRNYEAEPEPDLLTQSSSVSIDDRDSFFFQTVNSDDDVTIIDDSFNAIDNSSSDDDVIAIDADNSFNSQDNDVVTAIQDNDTVNQDTDVLVVDAENSFNDTPAPDLAPAAAPAPPAAEPVADDPPVDEQPVDEQPVDEQPADDQIDQPIDDDPIDEVADPEPDDAADFVAV